MIRSYVATFAFVVFRILAGVMQVVEFGTQQEQLAIAAWLCWSLPLVITEVVLQSRKALGSLQAVRA